MTGTEAVMPGDVASMLSEEMNSSALSEVTQLVPMRFEEEQRPGGGSIVAAARHHDVPIS